MMCTTIGWRMDCPCLLAWFSCVGISVASGCSNGKNRKPTTCFSCPMLFVANRNQAGNCTGGECPWFTAVHGQSLCHFALYLAKAVIFGCSNRNFPFKIVQSSLRCCRSIMYIYIYVYLDAPAAELSAERPDFCRQSKNTPPAPKRNKHSDMLKAASATFRHSADVRLPLFFSQRT